MRFDQLIISGFVLSFAAAGALASDASSPKANGFHVTGSLISVDSTTKDHGKNTDTLFGETKHYTQRLGQSTFGVGLGTGYRHFLCDHVFTGIDVGVHYVNGIVSHTSSQLVDGTTLKNSLARRFSSHVSAVIGGYVTENFALYGKVGTTIGWFKLSSKFLNAGTEEGAGSKARTLWGLRPAVGAEYTFNEKLRVHIEAAREVYYARIRKGYNGDILGAIYENSVSVKPCYTTISVGVSYAF